VCHYSSRCSRIIPQAPMATAPPRRWRRCFRKVLLLLLDFDSKNFQKDCSRSRRSRTIHRHHCLLRRGSTVAAAAAVVAAQNQACRRWYYRTNLLRKTTPAWCCSRHCLLRRESSIADSSSPHQTYLFIERFSSKKCKQHARGSYIALSVCLLCSTKALSLFSLCLRAFIIMRSFVIFFHFNGKKKGAFFS